MNDWVVLIVFLQEWPIQCVLLFLDMIQVEREREGKAESLLGVDPFRIGGFFASIVCSVDTHYLLSCQPHKHNTNAHWDGRYPNNHDNHDKTTKIDCNHVRQDNEMKDGVDTRAGERQAKSSPTATMTRAVVLPFRLPCAFQRITKPYTTLIRWRSDGRNALFCIFALHVLYGAPVWRDTIRGICMMEPNRAGWIQHKDSV